MRILPLILCLLVATAASAETGWLTPAEFEARVSGKLTQVSNTDGSPFGAEFFGADRRVIFQFAGYETCMAGTWQPRGNAICYSYDDGTENCMRYRVDGQSIVGVDVNKAAALGDPVVLVITNAAAPACTNG